MGHGDRMRARPFSLSSRPFLVLLSGMEQKLKQAWAWVRARPWKSAGIAVAALLAIFLLPVLLAQPRLDRDWVDNLAVMPTVEVTETDFRLDGVSDWSYTEEGPATQTFGGFAAAYADLRDVWFVVEPQPGGDYAAHTLILFEFAGDRIVGLTVEARLEKEETYDAVAGVFNKFELAYVWASARDLLTRRVTYLDKDVYVYPLELGEQQKLDFLKALMGQTVDVSTHARFYNTFTSNCTNELAKVAKLDWHYSWVLTGYSPQRLYELELIPGETFDAAKARALMKKEIRSWNDLSREDFDKALMNDLRQRYGG